MGLGTSGFRTWLCSAGRQSCQGARWGDIPTPFPEIHTQACAFAFSRSLAIRPNPSMPRLCAWLPLPTQTRLFVFVGFVNVVFVQEIVSSLRCRE